MVQYGRIRLDNILIFELVLLITLPMFTYYVAVYKDGIAPFPHTSVTDTACPYPQNIPFRFGMMTAASFLSLVFYCISKWLKYQKQRSGYPGKIPSFVYFLSQIAIFPFTLAIGTIDSGGTGDLHYIASVFFFVILFGLTLYFTHLLGKMRNWDATVMSYTSWNIKRFTCLYIVGVWSYCLYGLVIKDPSKKDDWIVIVQWNTVIVNLLWLLSFRREWTKAYLTFNSKGNGDMFEVVQQ